MIAAMKQISLAFDCESRIVKVEANAVSKMEHSPNIMPNKLSIFAFVFNPSTVLFGPPIQFGKYSESAQLLVIFFYYFLHITLLVRSTMPSLQPSPSFHGLSVPDPLLLFA